MKTKQEQLEYLIMASFRLEINMNDTFHYACADVSNISSDDAMDLLDYIGDYGFDALMAYEAISRGYDPDIKKYITKEYLEVKDKILKRMEEESGFLCDLNFKKRQEKEQIAKYGGIISFKFVKPTIIQKIIQKLTKGDVCYICVCSLENSKIKGYGTNMKEAELDLSKKLGVVHG